LFSRDEFLICLPDTSREDALTLAEHLRRAVREHPFSHDGHSRPVTISLGVATTRQGATGTLDDLLREADALLYRAKRAGRNRVAG
jgi:two-component system chemotaxis response regulator CheY